MHPFGILHVSLSCACAITSTFWALHCSPSLCEVHMARSACCKPVKPLWGDKCSACVRSYIIQVSADNVGHFMLTTCVVLCTLYAWQEAHAISQSNQYHNVLIDIKLIVQKIPANADPVFKSLSYGQACFRASSCANFHWLKTFWTNCVYSLSIPWTKSFVGHRENHQQRNIF